MATMTLDQFLQLAETEPASEYACGKIFQKPMPTGPHAAIQLFPGVVLYPFLLQTGLGRAFTELRCIFGPVGRERTYVPDVYFRGLKGWASGAVTPVSRAGPGRRDSVSRSERGSTPR